MSATEARPIYLDYQATTPVDPRVVEAMLPYLTTEYGNPSSAHAYGRAAAAAVATARAQVAALIGAHEPDEIVFTSSGTESNHLALTGVAHAARAAGRGRHVITTTIEHPATQATCDQLTAAGFRITRFGVDLLTLVGHKMYAPKGIAALYIRGGTSPLVPQLVGGGQERGLRAATENVPGIVALGAAAAIAHAEHVADAARILCLRERLLGELSTALPGLQVNGSLTHRLPGNLSLTMPGITAEQMMAATPDLAFSAGAACLGIGRYTSDTDITTAIDQLIAAALHPAC